MVHMLVRRVAVSFVLLMVSSVLLALGVWTPPHAYAAGVVGVCTENDLRAALADGGDVSFSCGPAIITITSPLTITAPSTTIDGGGLIAISGGDTTRVLTVSATAVLTVVNLTVTHGATPGEEGAGAAVNGELRLITRLMQLNN